MTLSWPCEYFLLPCYHSEYNTKFHSILWTFDFTEETMISLLTLISCATVVRCITDRNEITTKESQSLEIGRVSWDTTASVVCQDGTVQDLVLAGWHAFRDNKGEWGCYAILRPIVGLYELLDICSSVSAFVANEVPRPLKNVGTIKARLTSEVR